MDPKFYGSQLPRAIWINYFNVFTPLFPILSGA